MGGARTAAGAFVLMMRTADARAALSDLRTRVAAEGAALIGRDGQVIAADLPGGAVAETAGIMAAAAFGAALAANAELGLGPPQHLVLEGDGSRSLILRVGDRALVLLLVGEERDLDRVLRESAKFANLWDAAGRPA